MAKKFMTKKKTSTTIFAVGAAALLMLGGTFAWQSISQQALNEVKSTVNPGGRLHDDFVETTETEGYDTMTYDKDVYVENFTSLTNNGVQVYARVRLDEYMEIGKNAGVKKTTEGAETGDETETVNEAESLIPGAKLNDKTTWTTYKYQEDSAFREYFEMTFAGSTIYMPTFNKDMNSLVADINGGTDEEGNATTYTKYVDGQELSGTATYADPDSQEENATKQVDETHVATSTLDSEIMSMEEYLQAVETGTWNGAAFDGTGDFWVYDTDGWAYWANPINPDTATGLLLDGVNRTETIINDDWYYAINVVAQFVTYEHLGSESDEIGFYDADAGAAPTEDALDLLNRIGVKVTYKADTAEALAEAVEKGGTVEVTADITLDTQITVVNNTVLNLGDHTITVEENFYDTETKTWSLISADGATLTINGGTFAAKENDSYCVDVRNGGKVIINGGTYVGNIAAVYVLEGEAVINGGTFSIQQTDTNAVNPYKFLLNCNDDAYKAGTAKITVCGGTFYNFNPAEDSSEVTIPANYTVTSENGVYTVVEK